MNIFENDSKAKSARDPIYCKILSGNGSPDMIDKIKGNVENLFLINKEYSNGFDKKFCDKMKNEFLACFAELYFGATFCRLGYAPIYHFSDGPDFLLKHPDLNCWAEVISPGNGVFGEKHYAPPSIPDTVQKIDERAYGSRLSGALSRKSKVIRRYLDEGVIDSFKPVIICISSGAIDGYPIPYPKNGHPLELRTALAIGMHGQLIPKSNQYHIAHHFIETDNCLLNDQYSHISAVVYSGAKIFHQISQDKMGADFITVHNPHANNPLPEGFIKCGVEYSISEELDSFKITKADHN